MTTNDKQPRHHIGIPPKYFNELEAFKKELEKELQMPVTFGQAIIYLINKYKDSK